MARLVFSQSCSVFFCVVSRRLRIISLMVSFRTATSPCASTVIERVRSPCVTATATSAMARTWVVRLAASWLTFSVSPFHVPDAPGTLAWPPSRPSTPTSRATVVTWSAKVASVPVMPLMVSASAAISPLASTVSLCLRSPLATAVTTRAMPRTWSVRLPAIEFTESVRSFQVPATPCTAAWPPSLPSVPTSRATRVTSPAKVLSWSTMVLMVFFSSRISPFTSTAIFFDRSPAATALVTSAMLRTWAVRLPAIELTLSVRSFQVPATPCTSAWPPSSPSVPTSRATRVTSAANERSWSTMVLMVFFSSRISPATSTVIFFDRSPMATAVVTSAMLRTWPVRLPAMEFTESVSVFQVPATPCTSAWPPSLPSVPTSRATRVTSAANERSWSTIVLMVFLSSSSSPFTSTVIFFDSSPRATAVVTSAMLRTWPVRLLAIRLTFCVRSFQVPDDALHVGLAAELAFGADLAGDARHLGGERAQLVHHRVDGVLELEQLALHVDGDLLRQVAARHGGGHLGDVAHLAGQVAGHRVHRVGEVLPGAGHALHVGLAAELAFGADLAGNARHLAGEGAELIDHGVDGARRAQELAFQRAALDFERHALGQVALRDGADHARHLARGVHEVFDQRVDGFDGLAPEAGHVAQRGALLELAFLAHHAAEPRQLGLRAGVQFHHVVEGVGDLAVDAGPVERQAHRGVALLDRLQSAEQGRGVAVQTGGCIAIGVMPVAVRGVALARGSLGGDLVEGACHFAGRSAPARGEPHRTVAALQGLEAMQQGLKFLTSADIHGVQRVPPPECALMLFPKRAIAGKRSKENLRLSCAAAPRSISGSGGVLERASAGPE